jgi:hypothetical protein
MATPLLRAYRYCRGDGSLTLAVGVLIVFVFVLYPMVEVGAASGSGSISRSRSAWRSARISCSSRGPSSPLHPVPSGDFRVRGGEFIGHPGCGYWGSSARYAPASSSPRCC